MESIIIGVVIDEGVIYVEYGIHHLVVDINEGVINVVMESIIIGVVIDEGVIYVVYGIHHYSGRH